MCVGLNAFTKFNIDTFTEALMTKLLDSTLPDISSDEEKIIINVEVNERQHILTVTLSDKTVFNIQIKQMK